MSVVVFNLDGAQLYVLGRPECALYRDHVSLQSWATTSLNDTAVYISIPSSQLNAGEDAEGSD